MKKINIYLFFPLLILMIGLIGCGPDTHFKRARNAERKGDFEKAWRLFQEFVAKYPKNEKAAEALFRAGWTAQRGLKDCYVANSFFERVLVDYSQSDKWVKAASIQPLSCPDYFPLIPGSRWIIGDSDTSGTIAKTIITGKELNSTEAWLPSHQGKLNRDYYAGTNKFRTSNFVYKKKNNQLLEYISEKDPRGKVLLQWPLEVGQKWSTKMTGQLFHYEVVSISEEVTVKAGPFSNCLKVKSSIAGGYGSRFEYYAPEVGLVLTTLSAKDGEKRNTELLSYEMSEIKFDVEEESQEEKETEE